VSVSTQTSNGSCTDNSYSITKTWTATDACGNAISAVQVITVTDTEVPVFAGVVGICNTYPASGLPLNIPDNNATGVTSIINVSSTGNVVSVKVKGINITHTWDEDLDITLEGPNGATLILAADNGSSGDNFTNTNFMDGSPSLTSVGAPFTGTFSAVGGSLSGTFAGISASGQWKLIVKDDEGSDVGALNAWSLELCTAEPLPTTLTADCNAVPTIALVATDCDANVAITVAENTTLGSCPNNYTLTRTYTATDNCGNSAVHTITINVQDIQAPVLSALPVDITVACNAIPAAAVLTATDNCGAVTVNFSTSNSGTQFPSCYTIARTWSSVDACGNAVTHTQNITVTDGVAPVLNFGLAPIVTQYHNTTATRIPTTGSGTSTCSTQTVSNIVITDAYSITDLNVKMRITHTDRQDLDVSLRAPDGTTIALFTDVGTSAGSFGTACPSNFILDDESATDVSTLGSASIGTFNPEGTAALSAFDGKNISGTWQLIVCDDASGDIGSLVCWTLEATRVGLPQNVTVSCESIPVALSPTASDNCDPAPVVSVNNVNVPGSCTNTYTILRTYVATDKCGNTSNFTQNINVQDLTAPQWVTLVASLNRTVQCSDAAGLIAAQALSPTANDLCDLTLTAVKVSGAFVPNVGCANAGTYTNTWTVADDCNNTSLVYTQVITVEDTQAPTWTTAANALDMTLECSDVAGLIAAQALMPIATDLCDLDVSNIVKTTGTLVAGLCPQAGTITNTWVVTDNCGNTSTTYTQVIAITDGTAPLLTTPFSDQLVQCDGAGNLPAFNAWLGLHGGGVANDACSAVTWTTSPTVPVLSDLCGATGATTVVFTATDACGNATSGSATFTIIDAQSPTFTTISSNSTVQCDGLGNTIALTNWLNTSGGAIATDACSGVTWTHSDATLSDGCGATGNVTVTFTATDACGNTAATTATFTIEDTTDPTLVSVPANETVDFAAIPTVANVTATDGCGTASVAYLETPTGAPCDNTFTLTRTWTATDECGNTGDPLSQVITIHFNLTPGSIAGNQTFCSDEDPMTLMSVSSGSGYQSITYRWESNYNGGAFTTIGGATTATYDPGVLTPAGTYKFRRILVSSGTYLGNPFACESVPSNEITNEALALTPISVSLAVNANTVCPGEAVIFTATPSNTGITPTYIWKRNGTVIPGASGQILALVSIATGVPNQVQVLNGDVITVQVTPDVTVVCPRPLVAVSNTQTIVVNMVTPATITIAARANPICIGTTAYLTATIVNGGVNPFVYWYVDNVLVGSGVNMTTFTTGAITATSTVKATITVYAINCPSQATSNSNVVTLNVQDCDVLVQTKAVLQGAYSSATGLMRDNLRTLNLIPLGSPYGTGETINASVLSGASTNNSIVDWVLVQLRDPMNPATVIHTRSALLQRDGDIVDLNGIAVLKFIGATPGNYYVSVSHRNHFGIRTPIAVALNGSTSSLHDFTTGLGQAYDNPSVINDAMVAVSGVFTMWRGDANGDRLINSADVSLTTAASTPVQMNVYGMKDLNLDGQINVADKSLVIAQSTPVKVAHIEN
jgi:subtilisin-like proprotein convertase family protein